jgi:hypothetical protein
LVARTGHQNDAIAYALDDSSVSLKAIRILAERLVTRPAARCRSADPRLSCDERRLRGFSWQRGNSFQTNALLNVNHLAIALFKQGTQKERPLTSEHGKVATIGNVN